MTKKILVDKAKVEHEPENELVAERFEAMHAKGDVWITTISAAALARNTHPATREHRRNQMTEEYSVGYDEGYQSGWNAAMDSIPAAPGVERIMDMLDNFEYVVLGVMQGRRSADEVAQMKADIRTAIEQAEKQEPVGYADQIAFDEAMRIGKGCDVWPVKGDYEQRTGRKLRSLYTTQPAAQPAPELEGKHALEQAMTRLQKRYGELEAKVAAQRQWTGLTDWQKRDLVTNWFAEGWAIKAAHGMLDDYDTLMREKNGGETK